MDYYSHGVRDAQRYNPTVDPKSHGATTEEEIASYLEGFNDETEQERMFCDRLARRGSSWGSSSDES